MGTGLFVLEYIKNVHVRFGPLIISASHDAEKLSVIPRHIRRISRITEKARTGDRRSIWYLSLT